MRSRSNGRTSGGLLSRIRNKEEAIRSWEGDDPSRKRTSYFLAFTVAFIAVAFITLFVYPSSGRSLTWNIDGLEQYYPFFVYEGQWLRGIVQSLIAGEGLQIPLWVHELGYGMDIPSTLDTFYDPLNLLSGLCPERYSEYLFQFLVVLRLYLAGIAFSLFAFRFKTGRFSTLIGALLYSLSGTALTVAFWPAGAWPLVLFPLLLLGVEKILSHEKPYLFILSITAFFVISYYFSYMACLFLLPYCIVRVVQTQQRLTGQRFLFITLRFIGFLLIGMLLACFALVPSLVGLFGLERFTTTSIDVPLFYPMKYYSDLISGFVSITGVGSDCYIGYGGLAFLACVLLFTQKGQHTALKVTFTVMSIMILVPAFGSVFNGFNYATNRWVWAYALLVSFIVARMLPNLLTLKRGELGTLVKASLVLAAITFLAPSMRTEESFAAGIVLLSTLFVLSQKQFSQRLQKTAVLICLTAGLTINAFYFISPDEGGVGKDSPPLGYMYKRLTTDSPNHLVSTIEDAGIWRYDGSPSALDRTRNTSLVLDLKGVDFYNSSYNSNIDAYHTELAVNKTDINFSYKDLDGRAILETLAGVKYSLDAPALGPLPYLYDNPKNLVVSGNVRGVDYQVHQGSHVLPLAYLYDSYIPREDYLALSPAHRQESLLEGVVLDSSTLPIADQNFNSQVVSPTITPGSGLTLEDSTIRVSSPGATLTLSFAGLPKSETYFYIDDLYYDALSPLQATPQQEFEAKPWYMKALLIKRDIEWNPPISYTVELTSDKAPGKRQIVNSVKSSHMYGHKEEWLVNMGYSEEGQTAITIRFNGVGEYQFSTMSVICQPMESVPARIDALRASPVDNLTFDTNRISASVNLERPKALYLAVPYSIGWTATVDGEQADIKKANTAFMALELEAGEHHIELNYMSPGLPEGLMLSGVGLLLFASLVMYYRFRRTRQHSLTSQDKVHHDNP